MEYFCQVDKGIELPSPDACIQRLPVQYWTCLSVHWIQTWVMITIVYLDNYSNYHVCLSISPWVRGNDTHLGTSRLLELLGCTK